MNKLSKMIITCMLGAAVAVGFQSGTTDATPVSENKVVLSTDNSVFKVATLRPERTLEEYRLFKYDVINLMALGHSDGIGVNDVTVGVDGMARIPYVGNVKLVGLTLDEARNLIHSKLSKYFKIPEFNVYLKSYGVRKVYVMGNVNAPGIKEMSVDNMNVYAAISSAGGVDKKGRSKHVQVLRQIDDRLYFREVNLDAFVKKHDLSQNIVIEDGDIIYVPDSGKVIWSQDIAPYVNIYAVYRSIVK
ncbi:polysaccharide biosynthesis/export family protein [uncultured Anaerovibrio sp.]|uniref:polysaccharide biosynthesis/export family protein n=1 Tax=uncultured Anaerovibrio sp. TaxID=361586 RepID=UPI0025E937E5|nr:polysaccharide biosynthesis/export family protein [uncultured Anaerovibrio sp.]